MLYKQGDITCDVVFQVNLSCKVNSYNIVQCMSYVCS